MQGHASNEKRLKFHVTKGTLAGFDAWCPETFSVLSKTLGEFNLKNKGAGWPLVVNHKLKPRGRNGQPAHPSAHAISFMLKSQHLQRLIPKPRSQGTGHWADNPMIKPSTRSNPHKKYAAHFGRLRSTSQQQRGNTHCPWLVSSLSPASFSVALAFDS
jgi:hypothetical protein